MTVAFSITSSKVHGLRTSDEMLEENNYLNNSEVPGDKGFISNPLRLQLFELKGIELNAQPRANIKTQMNLTHPMGALRHRIEYLLYQVQNQYRLG